jgi:hypothetical protein
MYHKRYIDVKEERTSLSGCSCNGGNSGRSLGRCRIETEIGTAALLLDLKYLLSIDSNQVMLLMTRLA